MADPSETIPMPEFIIDPDAPQEQTTYLEALRDTIFDSPKLALDSLRAYTKSPDAGSHTLTVLHSHGEAARAALGAVANVWESQADLGLSFDDATEAAIEESPDHKEAMSTPEPDARTVNARRVRISTFTLRWAAYQDGIGKLVEEKSETKAPAA